MAKGPVGGGRMGGPKAMVGPNKWLQSWACRQLTQGLEEAGDHSLSHLSWIVLERSSALHLCLRTALRAWPFASETPCLVGSVVTLSSWP